MPVLAQALFALVRRNLVSLSLLAAGHIRVAWRKKSVAEEKGTRRAIVIQTDSV
ncbi:MAG: hypothetical protein ACI9W4_000928 [Rhodothermales bacterium]